MTKFSDDLISETIKCFAEEYNHHIDKEIANKYLESLAKFIFPVAKN